MQFLFMFSVGKTFIGPAYMVFVASIEKNG